MKTLTRYVIRAHLGPFLFAFTAVTGLLFLNAIAQRIENLAGKGLPLSVFGEFLLLSLPHVIALTLPMSLLVATLYAFADLTGHNEVSAMAAGGVHPGRLIVPMISVGMVVAGIVFFFNNSVLPESNHRLSSLLTDIASKSPTFQLRPEVVNEVHTGDDTRYFLRARTIDPVTSELEDVTIFDLSESGVVRTITAEAGRMAFTPDRSDLHLTLDSGQVFEVPQDEAADFQRLDYQAQVLPLRGVGQQLERSAGGSRGDREMNVQMLREQVDYNHGQLEIVAVESAAASLEAVRYALGDLGVEEMEIVDDPVPPSSRVIAERTSPANLSSLPPRTLARGELVGNVASVHRINATRWETYVSQADRFLVEIHKKYAIAFACLIFVLLGPPLAMRFPQGGMGMTLAASVGIFFLYWVGLIAGERFADRGQVDPIVAMWASNLILLLVSIGLLWNLGDRVSTNRGSAWSEFRFRIGEMARRAFRRRASAGSAEAT